MLLQFKQDLMPVLNAETWNSLTTPGSEIYDPLWGPLITFEVISNLGIFICTLYLLVLFFRKSYLGEFRWLTVCSPEGAAGVELVLEPMAFPPARTYQQALFAAGIPATAFITNDITAEYSRLKEIGVRFRGEPQDMGPVTVAMFEDTCGNLINLVQPIA
jgi:hypothetical protein